MQSTEQTTSRTDAPQVTPSSNSSSVLPRRTPGATGHRPSSLGPRPPLPRRTVPLTARPLARELANQGWSDDDNRPGVPRRPIPAPRTPSDEATQIPSPRRSPEQPQPKIPGQRDGAYDQHVLGLVA